MAEIRVIAGETSTVSSAPKRHLISIDDLNREIVERLLATARNFSRSLEREMKKLPTLRGARSSTSSTSPRLGQPPASSWRPSGSRPT